MVRPMAWFEDLTPYEYDREVDPSVLNIGWLDADYPFPQGKTPVDFQNALRDLCARPMRLHRGFHRCQFCAADERTRVDWPRIGNGQIRVRGSSGVWYAAPTMVHHYVVVHHYRPPDVFLDAVLSPMEVGRDSRHS
jgi:hypothetical protein